MPLTELINDHDRAIFQQRALRDLDRLAHAVEAGGFGRDRERIGLEQELQFIDAEGCPAAIADDVAAAIESAVFQRELSRFSFEVALPPVAVGPGLLSETSAALRDSLDAVGQSAAKSDARVVLAGILPSLTLDHIGPDALSNSRRYELLHAARQRLQRGAEYHVRGMDDLVLKAGDYVVDGVFTSLQLHWQLDPASAARVYNWSQYITAPCLAAACASPLFLGRELWHETRVPLFEQTSDLRRLRHGQFAGPYRASLGGGWAQDILDVWREDLSTFPPVLGIEGEGTDDPYAYLSAFNGTVYRWNRLCLAGGEDEGSLRVEARALPAGLSLKDEMANTALWVGLMAAAEDAEPMEDPLPFSAAEDNLLRAARYGLSCELTWTDGSMRDVCDILLEDLIPMAAEALKRRGIEDAEQELAPVTRRCEQRRSASQWMLDAYRVLKEKGSQRRAVNELTTLIAENGATGDAVADWPLPGDGAVPTGRRAANARPLRLDDSLALAERRFDWEKVDRLPVFHPGEEESQLTRSEVARARQEECLTVGAALSLFGIYEPGQEWGSGTVIDAWGEKVPLRRILGTKTSQKPGPLLVVCGGVHGNELNGVNAAHRFVRDATPNRGTVVGLLGNLPALAHGRRFIDQDLNRSFLPQVNGETAEGREAAHLSEILRRLREEHEGQDAYLVDLHGTSGHTPPYLSAMGEADLWPLREATPIPTLTHAEKYFRGLMVEEASRLGYHVSTFETGCFKERVSVDNAEAILALLADALDMIPLSEDECEKHVSLLKSQAPTMESFEFAYQHAITPDDDFRMRPGFVTFQKVWEGEDLGEDVRGVVKAPMDGRLVMPLYQREGSSGFFIAT